MNMDCTASVASRFPPSFLNNPYLGSLRPECGALRDQWTLAEAVSAMSSTGLWLHSTRL